MKNLQGTRTLASGAKIVGADADSIQAPGLITSAGGGDNTSLNTGLASATFPAGHLIQTVSASFAGVQSIALSSGLTDVTGLSCSMTITSGNKVFILANVNVGHTADSYGALYVTDGSNTVIYQNTTAITDVGGSSYNSSIAVTPSDADAGDIYLSQNHPFSYLWTPGVTSITVKIRGLCTYTTGDSIIINRMSNASNAGHHVRGTSTLTIFEVQA